MIRLISRDQLDDMGRCYICGVLSSNVKWLGDLCHKCAEQEEDDE